MKYYIDEYGELLFLVFLFAGIFITMWIALIVDSTTCGG